MRKTSPSTEYSIEVSTKRFQDFYLFKLNWVLFFFFNKQTLSKWDGTRVHKRRVPSVYRQTPVSVEFRPAGCRLHPLPHRRRRDLLRHRAAVRRRAPAEAQSGSTGLPEEQLLCV